MLKYGPILASFSVYFRLFNMLQFKFKLKKSVDGVLGIRTRAAGWKAQTNPLSYGGTPSTIFIHMWTKGEPQTKKQSSN